MMYSASPCGLAVCVGLLQMDHSRSNDISCVAFSPDGLKVAAATEAGTVLVYDAATGVHDAELRAALGSKVIRSLAFSPGSEYIAGGMTCGRVILWEAATGQAVATLKDVNLAPTDADGKLQQRLQPTDTAGAIDGTGGGQAQAHGCEEVTSMTRVSSVAFSPSGHKLIVAGAGALESSGNKHQLVLVVFDTDTRRAERCFDLQALALAGDAERSAECSKDAFFAFLPSASAPASGGGEEQQRVLVSGHSRRGLLLLNLTTGCCEQRLQLRYGPACPPPPPRGAKDAHRDSDSEADEDTAGISMAVPWLKLASVQVSPDGRYAACAVDDQPTVAVWELCSPDSLYALLGSKTHKNDETVDVVFSAGGSKIIAPVSNTWLSQSVIAVWDVASKERAAMLPMKQVDGDKYKSVIAVARSSDGARVATASEKRLDLWDLRAALGESSTGNTGDGTQMGAAARQLQQQKSRLALMRAATLSRTEVAVSSAWAATAAAASAAASAPAVASAHTGMVLAVRFSPDQSLLYSCSTDRTIKVWDLASHACKASVNTGGFNTCLSFSQDGSAFACGTVSDAKAASAILVYDAADLSQRVSQRVQLIMHAIQPMLPSQGSSWCLGRAACDGAFTECGGYSPSPCNRSDVLVN